MEDLTQMGYIWPGYSWKQWTS